jgi:hypothetical protein
MKWSYDYKNRLPSNHFAFCDAQGICRLPIFDIRGKLDPTHLRNAISRLPLTQLPDERVRGRIKKALEGLLKRLNEGERITADEWTPITTTKLFANGGGMFEKYEQKIDAKTKKTFDSALNSFGAKPYSLSFAFKNGRSALLTAMPPDDFGPVGYVDARLLDRGGRTVSTDERIHTIVGDYHFTDGQTKIELKIK